MSIKSKQLDLNKILLAVFFLLAVVVSLHMYTGRAYAVVKNATQIAAAAKAKCGGGNLPILAACRAGYTAGYIGASNRASACNKFPESVSNGGKPQSRCESAFSDGQKARTADEGSRPSGGPNGNGSLDPSGGGSGGGAGGGTTGGTGGAAPSGGPNGNGSLTPGSGSGGGTPPDANAPTGAPANSEAFLQPVKSDKTEKKRCGNESNPGAESVQTRFDFGCLGNDGPEDLGPIEDFMYAVIRFLSVGVGLVVVLFIILSGIQYSASEGNAEATQAAKTRIQNAIIGLLLYLIAFALVQYLVPGGVFAGSLTAPPSTLLNVIEVIK